MTPISSQRRSIRRLLAATAAALPLLTAACADAHPPGGPGQGRHGGRPQGGPPQEALDACANRVAEEACAFEGASGAVEGACWSPNPEAPLACRPADHAGGPGGRGPAGGPPTRRHQETQAADLDLRPADSSAPVDPQVEIRLEGGDRVIIANGVPDHAVGAFPNSGNPNRIKPQRRRYRIPAEPRATGDARPAGRHVFGVGVNGVPFDPGAAEFYQGDPRGGWRYEPLGGAVDLGLDANNAHVQPTGAYHYHGLPTGLMAELGVSADRHSPLIGWAADGFPIYALYGYRDLKNPLAGVAELKSSYRLKEGERPGGPQAPGGRYDGAFVADYVFDAGSGDLDQCNGRFARTPEHPEGTYAYFLTADWPAIPRCFVGTPSPDFAKQRPVAMRRGPGEGPGVHGGGRGPGGGRGRGGPPRF